nr:50S ribosomal protein L25 [Candidatus Saccharibacteria bacterium]NIW78923.1 50S ribosomal protein L25 [Calditrichia bacterium]
MAVTIDAKKRDGTGTQSARRYRREGWIPGVFYLHGDDPVHLMFDHKKLYHFLHHAHGLVDLK